MSPLSPDPAPSPAVDAHRRQWQVLAAVAYLIAFLAMTPVANAVAPGRTLAWYAVRVGILGLGLWGFCYVAPRPGRRLAAFARTLGRAPAALVTALLLASVLMGFAVVVRVLAT